MAGLLEEDDMKMVIGWPIQEQNRTRTICRETGQPVPGNVETAVVKRVDCLMKHVPPINVVTVGQAGSNWQNSEPYRQNKNRTLTSPAENAGIGPLHLRPFG